jgi:hypothetical protein
MRYVAGREDGAAMPGPDTRREALLISAFGGLAGTLVDDYDVIDMLNRLAGYSVHPLLPSRTEI